jgi:hypothetical protein
MNKEVFRLLINKQQFEWPTEFITGSEIKRLVSSPADWVVNQTVPGPGDDPEVGNDQKVSLSNQANPPGEKKFTTRKPTSSPGQ